MTFSLLTIGFYIAMLYPEYKEDIFRSVRFLGNVIYHPLEVDEDELNKITSFLGNSVNLTYTYKYGGISDKFFGILRYSISSRDALTEVARSKIVKDTTEYIAKLIDIKPSLFIVSCLRNVIRWEFGSYQN